MQIVVRKHWQWHSMYCILNRRRNSFIPVRYLEHKAVCLGVNLAIVSKCLIPNSDRSGEVPRLVARGRSEGLRQLHVVLQRAAHASPGPRAKRQTALSGESQNLNNKCSGWKRPTVCETRSWCRANNGRLFGGG